MTAVLVHGVPETSAVWDGVRALLAKERDQESVALALPGFSTPRPPGFAATKDAYAAWLAEALRGIEEPIDVVGHDWGALLVLRVATALDVPLRSWAVDVANNFHPASRWHPLALTWQTPGEGEAWMRAAREAAPDSPDTFAARLIRHGVPAEPALTMGAAHDETMSGCILDLYRSAVPNVYADWGAQAAAPTRAPGLVLLLPDDAEDEAMTLDVARWLGARTDRLDGLDHCWMAQDPQATVAVLRRFWSSLPEALPPAQP
jgi:pimeloyl-ACP methyl ester carboxylesterase